MLDHLQPLPIGYLRHAVADRGHAIAQVRPPGPDINVLMSLVGTRRPHPVARASPASRSPGSNPATKRREKGEEFSIAKGFQPVF